MHGMKNMSRMGLLWMRQWSSQIRKRRVIHSNTAWHRLQFCETWHSHTGVHEDYALSTGEGLRTFRWNMAPSSRTVGPEDGELTRRQGEMSQMTWIFTNTAVRISQPIVPKHQQETKSTLHNIPKRRRSHLHHIQSLKSSNCGSVMFSAISMPRECIDWSWQGVFFVVLLETMLVIQM